MVCPRRLLMAVLVRRATLDSSLSLANPHPGPVRFFFLVCLAFLSHSSLPQGNSGVHTFHLDHWNSLWIIFLPPDFFSRSFSMLLPEGFAKTQVDFITSQLTAVRAFHRPEDEVQTIWCSCTSAPIPRVLPSVLLALASPYLLPVPMSPVLSASQIISRPPDRWRPLRTVPCVGKPVSFARQGTWSAGEEHSLQVIWSLVTTR